VTTLVPSGQPLTVESTSFPDGALIPGDYAFAIPKGDSVAPEGGNRSPHLRWSPGPEGTKSYAVVVYDEDVPVDASNAGVPGTVIDHDAERRDFAHLLLVDLPPTVTELAAGALSDGVTFGGKPWGETAVGGVTGVNDFTDFFAGHEQLGGTYGSYDGAFPPPNDERAHHYHFVVYALDVDSVGLTGAFGLEQTRAALTDHVLAQGQWTGVYSLNPEVRRLIGG